MAMAQELSKSAGMSLVIRKIVFLGAPSTGKSTLCEALSKKLQTEWVIEYGRDYWQQHQVNRRLSAEQLLHIAQTQNLWEDQQTRMANNYLLCDTNAFTTWHFALHYHNSALPELEKLAMESWQRYDLVVFCDTDILYDDTWERSGDANRNEFQEFLLTYLEEHNKYYVLASGSVDERVNTVMSAINKLN